MSAQVWAERACSVLVRSSSSSPALSAFDRPQPGMADMVRPGAFKSQALSARPALDSRMTAPVQKNLALWFCWPDTPTDAVMHIRYTGQACNLLLHTHHRHAAIHL